MTEMPPSPISPADPASPDATPERDALVIGGGPAGLQAALSLGRVHRSVTLVDSGEYRNAPVRHMHNVLAHDGDDPAAFRALGREQLAPYDVEQVRARIERVEGDAQAGFTAVTADGRRLRARRLVLATGLRDLLPAIPGLDTLWGTVAASCPFCHGHEMAGGHVVLLASSAQQAHQAAMMARLAARVTVLVGGRGLDADAIAGFEAAGAVVEDRWPVGMAPAEVDGREGALVHLDDGRSLEAAGVLLAPTFEQAAPFAEQLGLELLDSGCVRIDDVGRTSAPGVFAGGDGAHRPAFPMPMPSVVAAMAAGQMAGTACVGDLLAADAALRAAVDA